jgi:hypothetical protein
VLELSLLLRFGFTSDRERVTDWTASFPALAARANHRNHNNNEAVHSPPLSPTSPTSPQPHQHQLQNPPHHHQQKQQKQQYHHKQQQGRYGRGDPQYLHQTGGVAVRVRPGQGFAWVLNRLRVSDLALSLEQRFQLGHSMLADFSLEVERLSALHAVLHPFLAPRLAASVTTTTGAAAIVGKRTAAAGATVEGTNVGMPETSPEDLSQGVGSHGAGVTAPVSVSVGVPVSASSGEEHAQQRDSESVLASASHECNSSHYGESSGGIVDNCGVSSREKGKAGVKSSQLPGAPVKDAHTAYVLLLNRVWQFVDRLPDDRGAED